MTNNCSIKVLVSAYACGPNWGSEIGMGWNWVINLSNYCQLNVITELGFKKDIESAILNLGLKYRPNFYYIDIGHIGRKLFWKQGSFLFYYFYKKWQKKVYRLCVELVKNENFDIIHQLNMIGYREPGYLWKLKSVPYIIGPVGGYEQFPAEFYSLLTKRDKIYYGLRTIINNLQTKYLIRPHKAYKVAAKVISATSTPLQHISKYSKSQPMVIPETGAKLISQGTKVFFRNKRLRLVWVGILHGGKALSISLQSIAKSKYKNNVDFQVIGDGADLDFFIKLASELKIDGITWHGRLPNEKSKQIIANSDMLFFSSILEATSTVIFEALESGTPVLCHDTCGFGNVIDDSCGFKIPLINPKVSIELFAKKIDFVVENPTVLNFLKDGCFKKAEEHSWDSKAKQVFDIYKDCLR
jgi:glycosyltransferase involved in cell wall biosynthesis